MSRSYKKTPIGKCAPVDARDNKRAANRKFRRCLKPRDVRAGKSAFHRRYTDPWDIHDCVYRWSKEKAESDWEREERQIAAGAVPSRSVCHWHFQFSTKEKFLIYWKKSMIRK